MSDTNLLKLALAPSFVRGGVRVDFQHHSLQGALFSPSGFLLAVFLPLGSELWREVLALVLVLLGGCW